MEKVEILEEVIIGYRKLIDHRYEYDNISQQYQVPASFDKERVELFKNYFLDYMYPSPDKRGELNEAFESLDSYVKNPEKLLRILLDSGRLIFRFGRKLPKILNAGMKALKSFTSASKFEKKLVDSAIALEIDPPFDKEEIVLLIKELPEKDIRNFIANNEALFDLLHDRKLMKQIVEVLDHLHKSMAKRPDLFSKAEINGLKVGLEMVSKGDLLFAELDKADQQVVFDFITKMESDFLFGEE